MKKLFLGITTLSLSLFCSAPLWAAPVTPPKPAKNVETRITSDQLTYLAEKQLVIFDKNVHVVRPDIEIWADRITVYLKPPKGDAQKKEGEKGGMPAGMAAGDVDRIVIHRIGCLRATELARRQPIRWMTAFFSWKAILA